MNPVLLPAAAAAAFASLALADWWNRRVRGFLPDDVPRPGSRKRHERPIPLAGIALAPVLLAVLLCHQLWWLAGGAVAVAALGFVDDWQKERGGDLDWRWKAAVLLVACAGCATQAVDPLAQPGRWLTAWALAFVLTNATNFLDNTDGVAAGVAGTALLFAGRGDGALALCGAAALGFVPWNWPRPRLFLGDAGAYALGIVCAFGAASRLPDLALALVAFAVQFVDFAQVVTARLVIGVSPWVGDRRHLTHIAQYLGLPRVLVAPLFAALAAAAGWLALAAPWRAA